MSLPKPPIALSGHCSVVYDNTLYVYSPDGFQSIPLKEDGEWSKLTSGVSVTGARCVKAVPGGDASQAALWVVGGSTADASYPGLQKYSFSTKAWETISPDVWVTVGRRNHAATFLNQTNALLVFAGSQDTADFALSSQTFTISLTPPYAIQSYSAGAPPVYSPMLMPLDEARALMVGGDSASTDVWTFSPSEGWQHINTALPAPIPDQSKEQCTVVSGDDGSKILETYYMAQSPNLVTRQLLFNADGSPAAAGTTVGRKRRRDLTASSWPTYNSTLAPTTTRSGFSIAQDSNGLAVISGGNSDDPIAVFDQRKNTWVNSTELFLGDQNILVSGLSSTSSIMSATSTTATQTSTSAATKASTTLSSAATTTAAVAAAAASGTPKNKMLTVLGATLGAIFGIAALMIIILLLLRWKREKNKRQGNTDYVNEKDRLSFADRGTTFMHTAGGSVGAKYSESLNGSRSSLAIITGRGGAHKRNGGALGSDASTRQLVTKARSPLNDSMEMSTINEKGPMARMKDVVSGRLGPSSERPVSKWPQFNQGAASTTAPAGRSLTAPTPAIGAAATPPRSSGWSRYFNNNDTATNLATIAQGNRDTYDSQRTSAASHSDYTDSRIMSRSQGIPPLDLSTRFDGQRLSRVNTGSPTLSHHKDDARGTRAPFSEGLTAEVRTASVSTFSSVGSDDADLHRQPTSSWNPVGDNDSAPYRLGAAFHNDDSASSIYSGRDTMQAQPQGYGRNLVASSVYSATTARGDIIHPPVPALNLRNHKDASSPTSSKFPGESYYFSPDGKPSYYADPTVSESDGPATAMPKLVHIRKGSKEGSDSKEQNLAWLKI